MDVARPLLHVQQLLNCALIAVCLLLPPSLSSASLSSTPYAGDQMMDSVEVEAVYQVLEAINSEKAWRALYPRNLCMEGPHGVICGADEFNVLHVVELNMGWVSEANNNPECGENASISPAVTRFPYLRKLFFYNCFTQSEVVLPPFLWTLGASLQELVFLRNAKLVGSLPPDIAGLGNLKRLILASNALQGTIPTQLGELTGLIQLVLSRNEFTGGIPESFGALQKLRILDLSWNVLNATSIPPSILSHMPRLQKLDFSHNRITGSIPTSVGEASSLKLLDLSWNNLSGVLPDSSLGKLMHLRVLQMGHNSFEGNGLPKAMWVNMSRLTGVGMAEAGLSGRIPEAMGQLRSMRYLDLRGNMLEGVIPESLGRLPSIFEMDLSGNRLQGRLPFSAEFVGRMGRNLRVGSNQGLCSSSDLISSVLCSNPGLPVCPDEDTVSESLTRGDAALGLSPHVALMRSPASRSSQHCAVLSPLLLALVMMALAIAST